jgi:hypothetical protein
MASRGTKETLQLSAVERAPFENRERCGSLSRGGASINQRWASPPRTRPLPPGKRTSHVPQLRRNQDRGTPRPGPGQMQAPLPRSQRIPSLIQAPACLEPIPHKNSVIPTDAERKRADWRDLLFAFARKPNHRARCGPKSPNSSPSPREPVRQRGEGKLIADTGLSVGLRSLRRK